MDPGCSSCRTVAMFIREYMSRTSLLLTTSRLQSMFPHACLSTLDEVFLSAPSSSPSERVLMQANACRLGTDPELLTRKKTGDATKS